jgi:hypothetical protein
MSALDPRDLEPPPHQTLILLGVIALLVILLFCVNGVPV